MFVTVLAFSQPNIYYITNSPNMLNGTFRVVTTVLEQTKILRTIQSIRRPPAMNRFAALRAVVNNKW